MEEIQDEIETKALTKVVEARKEHVNNDLDKIHCREETF